ncbi:MAG: hypothetical protein KDI62_05270, partial [Anaerolineae bacterium]|nr:hypothetical protein [Anaerolineae bacterium]
MAAQPGTKRNLGWSLPKKPSEWGIWLILVLMFLFYLLPVYVMVNNGLKEAQGVSLSTMWDLPTSLSGGGFFEAWERLRPNMVNSLLMVIPATIISALIGAINGYLLAKW